MGEDSEQVEKRLVESFFFKTVGSVQVCSEFKSTAVNRLLVVAGDSGFTLWADGCEVNWSRTCDLVQRARSQQEESKKCWETIKPSASSLVTVLSLSPGEKFLAICREDGTLDIHSLADIVSNGEGSTLHFSTTLQSSPKSFSWQGEEFVCLLEGGDVRRGTVGALETAPICVESVAFGACSTELWATATASSPNVLNIHKGEQSTTVAIEKDGKEYRDMMINTIHWVNAQTILVACTVPHGNDLGLLHLVTLKEGDLGPDTVELIFVDFLTIEVAEFGKEMGPHLHTSAIEDWGLTFVAHGKARDMHFRTVGAPNGSPPFLLDTHPDGELSVPLTEDYDDNYVVGVGMDFTSEEVPVQWKAGDLLKDIDPCPLMVSATTDGHIRFTTCGWESAPYSLVHPPKVLGRVSEEETPQKNAEEDVEEDDTLPDAPAVSTFPQGSPADGTPTTSEKDFPPPPENDQEEEAADGTPSPATSLSLKQSEDEKEGKSEGSGTVGAFDTPSSSSFSLQPSSTPHTAGQTGGGFGTFNESTIGSSPIVTVPWGTPPSIVTNLGTPSGSKKGAFESLAGGSSGLFQTPVRDPSMWDNTSLNSGGNRPKSPEEPGSAMSGYGEMWNPTPALEGNQEKSTFGQLSGGELFGSHKEGSTGGAISDSLKKSLEAGISPPRADPRIGKGPSQKDNSSDFCRHESGWEGFSTQEREEEEEDEYETEEEGSPSFGDADNELQDVDSPTITNGTPRIPDSGQTQRRRVSSEEGSSPGAAERPFSPSNINDPGEGRVPPGLFPKAQKDTPIPTRERFGPPGLLPSAQEDPSTPPRGRNLGLADVGDEKNGEEEDPNFTGEQKSWKNPYFDSSSVPSSPGGLVGRRPFAPPSTPGIPENPDTMQAAHSPASEMQYRNELVYPPGLGFGDSQAPPSSSPIVGADVDRNWRDSDSPEQGLESDGIQRLIQGKEEEEDKSTTSTVSEKNANGELERLVESVSLPDGQGEAREGEEEVVEEETEPEPDRNLMVEIRQALELSRRKLAEHDEEWKRLQALYQILRDTKKRAAIMKEKCDELEHRLSCKQADAEIKSRVERVKETYRRVNSAVGTLGILQSFFKGNKSCNHTYATRQGQSAYYAVTEVIQEINAAGNSLHVRVEKLRAQQQKHRQIVQQRTPEDSNPMKLRTPWASMSPADRKHLVEEIKKRQPTISYAPGVAPRRRTQPDNDAGWTLAVSSEPAKTSPPPLPPKRLSIPGLTVPKRGASEQKSNRTPGPSMSREQGAKRPPPVDDGGAQDNSFGGPPGIVPGISMSTSQTFKAASQGSGGSPGNLNQNNVTTKAPAAVKASPSGGGFTAPSAKPSSISTSSAPAKRPAPSSSSEGFSAPSVQQNPPPQNSIFGSMSQLSMSDPSTVPTSKPAVPTQPSMGSVFGTGGSSPSPATPSSAPAPGPKSGQMAAFEVPKSSPSPVPFGSSASLSPNSGVGGPSPTPQSPPPGQGVFSGFSKQVTAKTSGNAFATNSLQVAGSGDSGGASPLGPFAQSPTAANPTGVPGFGAPGSPQPPNLGVSFGNTAVLGAGGVASQLGSLQAAASQPQQGINGGGGFGRYVAAGSGFGGLASGGGTGFGNLSSGGGTGFGNQSGGGVGFGNPSSGGGGFSNFASGGSAFGAVGATGGSGFGGLGAGPGFGGAGNSGFGQSGSGSGGDNKQNQGAMWQPRR